MSTSMMIAFIVTSCSIVTALIAVVSFVFGITRGVHNSLKSVYEKIDQERERNKAEYVRIDMFNMLQTNISNDMQEIRSLVFGIEERMNLRIASLSTKVESFEEIKLSLKALLKDGGG